MLAFVRADADALRSMTQGEAALTIEFARYGEVAAGERERRHHGSD